MPSLEETFASIRARRDKLDQLDGELAAVIQQVEEVLRGLKPGVRIEMDYETSNGTRWIIFQKHNGDWRIMWSNTEEEDKHTPLLSASRLERAHVFETGSDGVMPIEALIHEVPLVLDEAIADRDALVERARALSSAILDAGMRPLT